MSDNDTCPKDFDTNGSKWKANTNEHRLFSNSLQEAQCQEGASQNEEEGFKSGQKEEREKQASWRGELIIQTSRATDTNLYVVEVYQMTRVVRGEEFPLLVGTRQQHLCSVDLFVALSLLCRLELVVLKDLSAQ